MRQARMLANWRSSQEKPVIYHCINRVVDRRFVLGADEKEKFRTLIRMQEKFTGCRVLSYCLMDNHFHILLEVPPMAEEGLSDDVLLKRLSALYSKAFVSLVAQELADARRKVKDGMGDEAVLVGRIHGRFSYRMQDLGEFMKGLLQRYTQWHNRRHARKGRLWEDRYKSVIVEDGFAAKTMAAYIDLNPVRAGIVKDPAQYRWSSYGEAIGGGAKGTGKTARAGLVRALRAHTGCLADASFWAQDVSREYRKLLMAGAEEKVEVKMGCRGTPDRTVKRKGISKKQAEQEHGHAGNIPIARTLRCRVRYFTDGAVIGSRAFVNEAFASARDRFGHQRKDGARKLRGPASALAGQMWSLRDLRVDL